MLFERNDTMLSNIYSSCKHNNFNNGIFTVGAAHKISILDMIQLNKNNQIKVKWIYDEYNLDVE